MFKLEVEPTKAVIQKGEHLCRVWMLHLPSGRQLRMLVPWVEGDLPEILECQAIVDSVIFDVKKPEVLEAIRNGSFSR